MKPAVAKTANKNALEDLGRATLQIVHDLKNQLNGLKLYATFLRKRLDRDDRSPEERETVIKLIAGIDRAAREMSALVRYAQPLELHCQPHVDLQIIISEVARGGASDLSGPIHAPLRCEIETAVLKGELDPAALTEAFKAISEQAIGTRALTGQSDLSIHVRRVVAADLPEALIEWRGVKPVGRQELSSSIDGVGSVRSALAARVIQAHGGRIEYTPDAIRAWLPLTE